MSAAAPAESRHVRDMVGDVVGEYVAELQQGYRDDKSSAVAALAQLRRGAGKAPAEVPELWGVTGTERLHHDRRLSAAEAERAESALFLAVTLYALHQQSRPQKGMHRVGVELGMAVRRLMPPAEIDEPIRRRFVRVGMATTVETLAYRLREIVSLLRREEIPLDYALLARHLYQAQTPEGMQQVRQIWGRGFHAYRPMTTETANASTDEAGTDKDTE